MDKPLHIIITRLLSEAEYQKILAFENAEIISIVKLNLPKYTYIETDPELQPQTIRKTFEYIKQFGQEKFGEKTVAEHLFVNNYSYWYHLRFTIYVWLFPINIEKQHLTDVLGDKEWPNAIFFTNYMHVFPGKYELPKTKKRESKAPTFFKFLFIFITRFFVGLFQHFRIGRNKNFVFLEPYNLQKILDINRVKELSFISGDYYNEYLTDFALKQNDFAFISDYYIPKFNTDIELKKELIINKYTKKSLYFELYFGLNLCNPFFLYKLLKFRKKIKAGLRNLISHDFEEARIFKSMYSKGNLLMLMYGREKIFESLAKSKKMKSVTCHHEQAYHHFSFFQGAKKANVPTIGFQHGIIHSTHIHYLYMEEDKKYSPVSDYMITWGEHWKDLLIEQSIYTPNQLPTLGQTRTDVIPLLKELRNTEQPLTLFYASQPNYQAEMRLNITRDIFQVVSCHPHCRFIIKPHPGEKDAEYYFQAVAQEFNVTNWELSKDDLYVTLNACDILITHNSTVGSEAIYFKKPVIIYDYSAANYSAYMKYPGAVFKARNTAEFDALIKEYEKGSLIVSEKTQEEFIHTFCYKIDGQTSARYIDFIRKVSK